MALHTEDTLRCPRIAQVLDLLLAVPALEALGAKSLVAGQDGQILDLVRARAAAVRAIAADQRAVAE